MASGTLADRLETIIRERKTSARKLSVACGLAATQITTMIARNRENPDNVGNADTLAKIAAAVGISLRWLSTGEGEPHEISAAPLLPSAARPRFELLPNWPQLLQSAKALDPAIPQWAWDEVARSNPLATAPITPRHVVQIARIAMELLEPPNQ